MFNKLSIRARLTFWYSLTLGLALGAFGFITYWSVSNELQQNLDASLIRVANSLDLIIAKTQAETMAPLKPFKKKVKEEHKKHDKFEFFRKNKKIKFVGPVLGQAKTAEEGEDVVWSAVYEHILLNPKNYFIQIADTNNQIVWRSNNFQDDSLPIFSQDHAVRGVFDNLPFYKKIPMQIFSTFRGKKSEETFYTDSSFSNNTIKGQNIRLFMKNSGSARISVGYTAEDIQSTLTELFASLLIGFPVAMLFAIFGGLMLSKLTLRSIDRITLTAKEITASNLSRRLPMPSANDEMARLTQTLNEMIERLENSFAQIKQFSSDVSHELRTPLTILIGELELALRSPEKSAEEYEMLIASSLEEASRLTNVVETLLELSRAETGQVQMKFALTNLTKFMIDLCEDAEILAEGKDIVVEKNVEFEVDAYVDSPRLHQAIINIIDNAIKYTPDNGKIYISLKKDLKFATIKVTDTGMGIAADELPHIFDRFYRVDKARSHDIRGVGLGLSIVKWIVEAHNGKIVIESEVKQGTKFTISFPLIQRM